MSDDNKSGSDLDIFEGLGKKSAGRVSAVPPPPGTNGASFDTAAASQASPAASVPSAPPAPPPPPPPSMAPPGPRPEMKRTLMGIAGPAQLPSQAPPPAPPSGRLSSPPPLPSQTGAQQRITTPSAPPSPSKPPPPPGRASLPNLSAQTAASVPSNQTLPSLTAVSPGSSSPSATTQKVSQVPPPPQSVRASAPPTQASSSGTMPGITSPVTTGSVAQAAPAAPERARGGKLDMDWDDDQEATHVFDKDSKDAVEAAAAAGPESRAPEHASMEDILSQRPAAGSPATATLSGAFGALGQPRDTNGASSFKSGAPPSQSQRSAPPPPPASMRPHNPSTSTAPIPPPPPPGQTTTAPMHMPVRAASTPPGSMQDRAPNTMQMPQMPPVAQVPQQPSYAQPQTAPMPQMPPPSRNMEATAVVPRAQQGSKAGMIIALIVGVFAAMAIAGFFLMPRTGTLVVNVADAKGGAVSKLEILVDEKKACDAAPCIVHDVPAGVHQVKVVAQGYEPPAPRAVTVEGRKDSALDFTLNTAAGGHGGALAGGTGLKASGTQSGVRLVVDGKEYGPLPQEIHDLTPGEHKVKLVGSDRYAALEKTVEVKQDELLDLGNVALKVLKGKATIQLGTPGAKVYLVNGTNRKEVPQFPIAIDFDPNEKWQLEAKMPGMEDYSSPISFDDGQAEKTIVVTLSPKGTTAAPTTAAAPFQAARPAQQPTAAWIPPKEPSAPVAAPKEPAAAGGEAFLNINSRPAATVLLDGKPLGPTPRVKVSVTPGTHTVLFVNAEESLKKSVSVTVAAGETKAVTAKLRD
ncbi:MAG: serine/threonine protein kinase [Labilithrix sp.]|nr:serine/threonine protein kinase [Labilithrix sp.]